jgi:diguanylate cyclase (GGDEF)-like protein/PAS domain S-box-containing protein
LTTLRTLTAPGNTDEELSELIETLRQTGQRLEEVTAGQVDTVVDREGRTFFLRGTQEQLRQSVAGKQAAILNGLPAHVALLDGSGIITMVNDAWWKFDRPNVIQGSGFGMGLNYVESCCAATGENSAEAHRVAAGIRSVLSGAQPSFSTEYSCHSLSEQRWFQLTITPLSHDRQVGAVVMHIDITGRYRASEALRKSMEEFRTLAESMPQIVWITRPNGECIYFSQQWMDYTGLTPEQSLGEGWSKACHPEDHEQALLARTQAIETGGKYTLECRLRRSDGQYRWWLIRGVPRRDAGGTILKWFGTCTDIHDLKMMEEALSIEKELAQVTLASIGDAVICTDRAGNIAFLNPMAEQMTRWSCNAAKGRPMGEVFRVLDPNTREITANPAERAMAQDRTIHLPPNSILIGRDGFETPIEDSVAPIHDRNGQATGAVIVFRDVSAAQAMSRQMTYAAEHDFLTGLPNRLLLNDRVHQAIFLAERHGKKVGLLFLDLDGFKHINDSLGHATGDKLLQSVAQCLVHCVRGADTVSRQGGDEFVVLLSEMEHSEDAAITARRMLQAIAAPHRIDDHSLHVTTSIGLSVFPDDGLDAETLIKNADTAMYQAKENGRHSYQFFKPVMNVRAVERHYMEENLRHALKRDEFALHYQPKVNLLTGAITGAEALIRWTHSDRGIISPVDFIPVAEDSGLILPIGKWVLREACKQAQIWINAGLRLPSMSVNISAREFRQEDFLEGVLSTLKDTGFNSSSLELELTESVLMKRIDTAASVLKKMRAEGIHVAIDDFGTGYSSLSYLRKFPSDTLKIDQSFVQQITADSAEKTIVPAVIGMGRNLDMRVVAEGVETQEQLAFLKAHHCDEAQGYYFSRPVPASEFTKLLETGVPGTALC